MFSSKKNIFILIGVIITCWCCKTKTQQLLINKWQCVQIDNLAPVNKNFLSSEDSLVTSKLEAALQNLTWQFNTDDTYQCSSGSIITAEGNYVLTDDGKLLSLASKRDNTNTYIVVALTENTLILKGQTGNTPVVLHFKGR
jgi:hypothetical protein